MEWRVDMGDREMCIGCREGDGDARKGVSVPESELSIRTRIALAPSIVFNVLRLRLRLVSCSFINLSRLPCCFSLTSCTVKTPSAGAERIDHLSFAFQRTVLVFGSVPTRSADDGGDGVDGWILSP